MDQNAYKKSKLIINENKPKASHNANPKIAKLNNSCFKEGLRDTPPIKEAKMSPIPVAAPPNAIVAKPAPINFAAININQSERINA